MRHGHPQSGFSGVGNTNESAVCNVNSSDSPARCMAKPHSVLCVITSFGMAEPGKIITITNGLIGECESRRRQVLKTSPA
jgi:hypothetical protein